MVWTVGCFIAAASGVWSSLSPSSGIWWRVLDAADWVVWVMAGWLLMLEMKSWEKTARFWENNCTAAHRIYRSQIKFCRVMIADLWRQLEAAGGMEQGKREGDTE